MAFFIANTREMKDSTAMYIIIERTDQLSVALGLDSNRWW